MVLFAVALGLAAIAAGAAYLVRYARTQRDEAGRALADLAASIGAPAPDTTRPSLTGTFRGRACQIAESGTLGSSGTSRTAHVRVATTTGVTFELQEQSSALGARLAGDVEIGDGEFDKWFLLRTNDLETVRRALTPELRRQLLEALRSGWLLRVWIKDGHLHVAGRHGLRRASDVGRASEMLDAAERLAAGIE